MFDADLPPASSPRPIDMAELIARYDARAPRYTSYPTALQFTPQVSDEVYRQWLSQLPTTDPVSLYVHIPFCAQLCWYCGCNTRAVNRREPIGDYVKLLLQEIDRVAETVPGRLPAQALHFGGGTPNMLSNEELEAIIGRLRQRFDLAADLDFAAELDSSVLTRDWVMNAGALGLNRASFGVQNLSPEVQKAVNRTDSLEDIARCVGWLREAGVRSINLDLMYGLPHQTVENTISTLDQILKVRPERLALFGYAHVPWMKAHQKLIDQEALPGTAERLEQSERAADRLIAEGYRRIGLDHYALADDSLSIALDEGRLNRNFQGYTTDTAATLIGFGASAIGELPQGFVQNSAVERDWRAAISAGRLGVVRGVALTDDDRFRSDIIERLMCDFAVDLDAACARHGRAVEELAPDIERLAPFEADGLVVVTGTRVDITPVGRLLVRSVAAAFDAYFDHRGERHSRVI